MTSILISIGGPCIETVYAKNSTTVDLRSKIKTPLTTEPLSKLLNIMVEAFKHNFIPGETISKFVLW